MCSLLTWHCPTARELISSRSNYFEPSIMRRPPLVTAIRNGTVMSNPPGVECAAIGWGIEVHLTCHQQGLFWPSTEVPVPLFIVRSDGQKYQLAHSATTKQHRPFWSGTCTYVVRASILCPQLSLTVVVPKPVQHASSSTTPLFGSEGICQPGPKAGITRDCIEEECCARYGFADILSTPDSHTWLS